MTPQEQELSLQAAMVIVEKMKEVAAYVEKALPKQSKEFCMQLVGMAALGMTVGMLEAGGGVTRLDVVRSVVNLP